MANPSSCLPCLDGACDNMIGTTDEYCKKCFIKSKKKKCIYPKSDTKDSYTKVITGEISDKVIATLKDFGWHSIVDDESALHLNGFEAYRCKIPPAGTLEEVWPKYWVINLEKIVRIRIFKPKEMVYGTYSCRFYRSKGKNTIVAVFKISDISNDLFSGSKQCTVLINEGLFRESRGKEGIII